MLWQGKKAGGGGGLTGGWKPNYLGERGHCTLELPDKKIAASRLFSREPPVHVCSWSIDASPLHVRWVSLSSDEQHQQRCSRRELGTCGEKEDLNCSVQSVQVAESWSCGDGA